MKLPLGFRFQETMSGTWVKSEGGADRRPIEFSVSAQAADLAQYLKDSRIHLSGTISVEGLAARAPAEGSMVLSPVRRRVIRYEMAFTGDDGRPYRLEGEKRVRVAHLVHSMTTLSAVVLAADSSAEVGRAELRFDVSADLFSFLRSWRPVLA
jgi:hypothetical protein